MRLVQQALAEAMISPADIDVISFTKVLSWGMHAGLLVQALPSYHSAVGQPQGRWVRRLHAAADHCTGLPSHPPTHAPIHPNPDPPTFPRPPACRRGLAWVGHWCRVP